MYIGLAFKKINMVMLLSSHILKDGAIQGVPSLTRDKKIPLKHDSESGHYTAIPTLWPWPVQYQAKNIRQRALARPGKVLSHTFSRVPLLYRVCFLSCIPLLSLPFVSSMRSYDLFRCSRGWRNHRLTINRICPRFFYSSGLAAIGAS